MKSSHLVIMLCLVLAPLWTMATHNRAGEITYEHISGFTYRITVTTYTKESAQTADRCELDVKFGDGTTAIISRVNGSTCTSSAQTCLHCGQSLGKDTKKNVYIADHTYPGTGSYKITMEDPNRNQGVINIPNSVQIVYFIYAELIIYPAGIPNSSPKLHYPPIDDGCVNVVYEHNPGAVDQDISKNGRSDSLSYKLVSCLGSGGAAIAGYTLPDNWPSGPNNNISIDSQTGTLLWDSPKLQGEYNVAILIEEWRKVGSTVVKIGSVLRDLQITIANCYINGPPEILPVSDTCITATSTLLKEVTAQDFDLLPPSNNDFQTVELSAQGDPFYVQGNKSTFPSKSDEQTVTQEFRWVTQCNHVRAYPYFVVFRAEDNAPKVHLTDYLDWRIKVLGPAPTHLSAEPFGAGISVSWSYSKCTNATGFRIYRKTDSIGYQAPVCETGIPASTGYQLVGSVDAADGTIFFDNGHGKGLVSGQNYCYMVFAYFDDGAEGYPSVETCATLLKEVPIITRVSVNSTHLNQGSDTVKWSKPTDIDAVKHPGPYRYKVLRKVENSDYTVVYSSPLNTDISLIDTVFVDSGINTLEKQHTYRIEVYDDQELLGPSQEATSPWLRAKPLDNRLELSLKINVPWINRTMFVYKANSNGNFVYMDSANSLVYTDSNLINGKEYCYYITTKGDYSDSTLEFPILNHSQILCAIPEDNQAPCAPPNFEVQSECLLYYNDLSWDNANESCDTTDDVVSYNIYYHPFIDGEFKVIANTVGVDNTMLLFDELKDVQGCYAVTAVDSFNNESELSNVVCVDNCPYYELPNIFTPGGDGRNDYFIPMPHWRYIQEVEMHVYNRWGEEVYFTTDPALGWDGTSPGGEQFSEGTYFYYCKVFEIRLEGIIERILKGNLTLLREEPGGPRN